MAIKKELESEKKDILWHYYIVLHETPKFIILELTFGSNARHRIYTLGCINQVIRVFLLRILCISQKKRKNFQMLFPSMLQVLQNF